ncbi:hypothetical protein FRC04_005846 [Tulasnella sp. 424]|nr:hypothetical protein FRC04_005846 [Tulasnella sp. 424]KAG8975991.1 hypothetical protein FRC05_004621 [Tulasnella sp. 425]
MCGTFSLKNYDGELTYGDGKQVTPLTTRLWNMTDDIVQLLMAVNGALLTLLRFLVNCLMILFIILFIQVAMGHQRQQHSFYCPYEKSSNSTGLASQTSVHI